MKLSLSHLEKDLSKLNQNEGDNFSLSPEPQSDSSDLDTLLPDHQKTIEDTDML